MLSLFKQIPVYIKISTNKVVITNLETGETISKNAVIPFSTARFILSDFNKAAMLIRPMIKELIPKKGILPRQLKILIQQTEEVEGGLSEIEKRALRDLGEMAGGGFVILIDHFRKLSDAEALIAFPGKK